MVQQSYSWLEASKDELAHKVTDLHFERYADRWNAFGEQAKEKCRQDTRYHLDYLAEALLTGSPTIFVEYVEWAQIMLSSRGISGEDLELNLLTIREILDDEQSGHEAASVLDFLDQGVDALRVKRPPIQSWILDNNPLKEEAETYLQCLLRGDRQMAGEIVDRLSNDGVDVAEIYEHIFQATQYEVGLLWQKNEITVAHEHFCTAATQNIMIRLYPRIFSTTKKGLRLVSCSVADELHEMGIRMVTDLFELNGWDTYYLGANLPEDQICRAIEEYNADLVAVSVTLPIRVSRVRTLIQGIRLNDAISDIPVMVGGYPFVTVPDLWKRVGADGSAGTAREAIQAGEALVERRGNHR
ncbi:MAG: cobalamin-dependent protein [Balneolaceae bacterium]